MKAVRLPICAATAVFAFSALWALAAWHTEFGISLFVAPGELLAQFVFSPSPTTYQAQSARSPAEGIAQLVFVRGLQRGLEVWWCSVVFWLTVPPAIAFFGAWLARSGRA
jgi:hypothetical protein